MQKKIKDSTVTLGKEAWTVKYFSQVHHPKTGEYLKAARVPSKKEIWLSLETEDGKKIPIKEVAMNFQKAALPVVTEAIKKEKRL